MQGAGVCWKRHAVDCGVHPLRRAGQWKQMRGASMLFGEWLPGRARATCHQPAASSKPPVPPRHQPDTLPANLHRWVDLQGAGGGAGVHEARGVLGHARGLQQGAVWQAGRFNSGHCLNSQWGTGGSLWH